MKLNTRVLLLVAPVILLSAAISSYGIYENQKDALIKRETSYLQLTMEKLAGHFRQSYALVNSYALTLSRSEIVLKYLRNQGNAFIEVDMLNSMQRIINSFQSVSQDSIGIAILDDQYKPRFFADNQKDPFSTIDIRALEYVRLANTLGGNKEHIGFSKNQQGQSILIHYQVIEPKIWNKALPSSGAGNTLFMVYMTLEQFDQLQRLIEFDTDSSIFFTDQAVDKSGLNQSIELKSGLFATLDPAQYLLEEKLREIKSRLFVFFIGSSIFTLLLLLRLLYHHVTSPLTKLDKQLLELERNQRNNIDRLPNNDEIGRLSERFYSMYQELQSAYQKTKALAENDHLTGLANRYQFQNHVRHRLANNAHCQHAWILYIDLDNFKYVNDKYGHCAGDKLLTNFANHIQTLCQDWQIINHVNCLPARLSGDEFAIFVAAGGHNNHADTLAQAILDPLVDTSDSPLGNLPITASIGIARYPSDGKSLESLLSNADTAMYQAKRAGKNQVSYYSEKLDSSVRRRTQIERALRSGEFDKEFSLRYQPYYNRSGEQLVGVEALLRWHSPKLGKVAPEEFIPISEQTGIFGNIDRWVIEQAFRDFSGLQAMFEHEIQLSINLSSAELDSKQLAVFIQMMSLQYQVKPHLVDFEITETFATDSQSYSLLHELSTMGFKLAIDDFGSGYTSITQLVEYPVQKIKLDREFLAALIKTDNRKVVKPLVDLCHSQAMIVTAEGIESEDMHNWLADNQCDFMQGYYLSPPVKLSQLREFASAKKVENHAHSNSHRCFA
ncbi:putative bifunctional diguanylate cyclase/phosphodiesterase [Vibrio panuliri]|uniref:Diguanylate phosphodiesterase n=1 Tax=Vibrio panuliri TaxID=1381081 RepID=A0A1Q9H9E3_9VIBR|nr:EAL domain-containing protein [Vibrio panuliri]KAB1460163.1 EAL domain-containing protein [Vibrio panuliri]OLQ85568.1 diguanylate phosphodiesterase [Vibrio panuliri]OLQ96412.1 diguanylate phosphodiesterase [Vibrio panuliri]